MPQLRFFFASVIALAACKGGGDASSPDAGLADASSTAFDAAADASAPDASAPDASAQPGCGDETLPSITGTEGLAIAADGTAYYSQRQAIGRRLPGADADDDWVRLSGASTIWGLALREDGILFVLTPSLGAVYRIDTAESAPTPELVDGDAGAPNGATIGPDGALYFSDFDGGHVYRVDDAGDKTRVTSSSIAQANGLLFDDDGTLLVLSYATGDIHRLTLDAEHAETARQIAGSIDGNPDGLAKDDDGNYYVTDNSGGQLLRLSASFDDETVLRSGIGAAANVAFGRGALSCTDVYVASSGRLARVEVPAHGRP